MKCLCGFKLYEQRSFNLPPFLTENNNANGQQLGILHWNYQQKLSKILDFEQKGTFKYRQAAGALNEIKELIRELNNKIAEFFGGKSYLDKLTLKQQNDNSKIASVDTVKNLLKLISRVEPAGQNANDLLKQVENVGQVLEAIAKQAFDTMEMMAENE
ncbi:hypothetical protein niasHT_012878 [Heterodera trifolii]|uniref:Uncharacterized protein n=1 Tax=Heterodera trifolii TaxID=157864 RepID=A0ABD2KYD3_9BILA